MPNSISCAANNERDVVRVADKLSWWRGEDIKILRRLTRMPPENMRCALNREEGWDDALDAILERIRIGGPSGKDLLSRIQMRDRRMNEGIHSLLFREIIYKMY